MECVFCEIVAGRADSLVVWDDDRVIAFMDLNPVTDGHVLVVPKAHSMGLDDIDPPTASRMMWVAQRLSVALKESSLHCDGVNLFLADGEAAFQEVFHSHLHVFPRFEGDGFTIGAQWKGRTRHELARAAEALTSALR